MVSHFNHDVTEKMKEEAVVAYAKKLGANVAFVKAVRGAFEIPLVAKAMLKRDDVDGVVTLGCVLKGGTKHDEVISFSVGKQLLELSCEFEKPVSLGIMGPGITKQQAIERIPYYAQGAVEGVLSSKKVLEGKEFAFEESKH